MASTATKVLGIGCGLLCFLLIVLGFFYYVGSHATTQPAQIPAAPPLRPLPDDTTEERAKIRDTILTAAREAEARGSYSDAKMILTGATLGYMTMPSWLANEKEIRTLTGRLDKEIAKARADANKIGRQLAIANRVKYADTLRNHFLDQGMDIKVRVLGTNKDRLYLKFVLFNDVWTHKFSKGDLIDEIKAMGFKRVDFDSGYDYHAYFDL